MPRSRTRRIAKWTGLVVCAVILATWMASIRWMIYYSPAGSTEYAVFAGGIMVSTPSTNDGLVFPTGLGASRNPQPEIVLRPCSGETGGLHVIFIPLWLPLFAIANPTVWLWRRGRRHPPGHCRKCGYDLTGNVTNVCSECATEIEAA